VVGIKKNAKAHLSWYISSGMETNNYNCNVIGEIAKLVRERISSIISIVT